MRTGLILWSLALIGLVGLPGGSASAHHTHGATRHHVHGVVVHPAYPRQAYYWQNEVLPSYSQRPALQSLGGYCPPPRLIPHNRAADNAHDVDVGEYCD